MKKTVSFSLILVFLLQAFAVGALEYKPKFSCDSFYGGRVIKSDFLLWEFEYKDNRDYLDAEKIDDDIIDIESNGIFRIRKDNSLWVHKYGSVPEKVMDDVQSICTSFATSQDYGYYVIKTDGSLWVWSVVPVVTVSHQ